MTAEKPMPQDYLRLCLEKRVKVQVVGDHEIIGVLHAYDEHYSLVISDADETGNMPAPDGTPVLVSRKMELVFVRGDRIITISPAE
jgi:U6 snRNA-associated Sm-like protein LSm3